MTNGTGDRKPAPKSASSARDERLAAALRANLRRRKAQERARAAGQDAAPSAPQRQDEEKDR